MYIFLPPPKYTSMRLLPRHALSVNVLIVMRYLKILQYRIKTYGPIELSRQAWSAMRIGVGWLDFNLQQKKPTMRVDLCQSLLPIFGMLAFWQGQQKTGNSFLQNRCLKTIISGKKPTSGRSSGHQGIFFGQMLAFSHP